MAQCGPPGRNVTHDGCPLVPWEPAVVDALYPGCTWPDAPTMVNVGANKGYGVAEFLQLWQGARPQPSSEQWGAAVGKYATLKKTQYLHWIRCGACSDCRAPPPWAAAPWIADGQRGCPKAAPWPDVHALELTSENRELLRYVVRETGVDSFVTVWDLAGGNESVDVRMPRRRKFIGNELVHLPTGPARAGAEAAPEPEPEPEWVEVTTVDAFLRRAHVDAVHHLKIDTEGHDALVLEGAREALRARRIEVVSFEYSGHGYWNPRLVGAEHRTLEATQRWLLELGYRCFLVSKRTLHPLSGACWRPAFEARRWSNVACSARPPAIAALEALAGAR